MIEVGVGFAAGWLCARLKNSVVNWFTRAEKRVEKALDASFKN